MEKTLPKPTGIDASTDPLLLEAGRYGTNDMSSIWGPLATFSYNLKAISTAVEVMSYLHPKIVPPIYAKEISEKANLKIIKPERIRELEHETGHDVIATQRALEEQVSKEASPYIGLAMTSADVTETAKARQIKDSIPIITDSIENLRDITIEKSIEWIDIPHMDQTHMQDALPTVAGRPFSHYAETLQSDLNFWSYVYRNSIKAKWSDAVGNYQSANALDIDALKLEEEYCKRMGLDHMIASAQVPAREFIADVAFSFARTAETMNNMAQYIALGKGDDIDIFIDTNPKKRKGSFAMPHKDKKGGNPTIEEQTEAFANATRGTISTMLSSCKMRYGRDLTASSTDRIELAKIFRWGDYVIRRLSSAVFYLDVNKDRSIERVNRTFETTTSSRVLTYLTNSEKTSNPMPRSKAHDLLGELATKAYNEKIPFSTVLLENKEITSRLSEEDIKKASDPMTFIGESKRVVRNTLYNCYKRKTLLD
jgi:adenylosuccinate lyase